MIVVVSCHPTPDDERIYHRQIKTLLGNGYSITYFTRSKSELDLSESGLKHINLNTNHSLKSYMSEILNQLNVVNSPSVLHIHDPYLLRLAKIVKDRFGTKIIYDVHEDYPAIIDTFSRWGKSLKLIKKMRWLRYESTMLSFVDHIILASPFIVNSDYKKSGFHPVVLENFPSKEFFNSVDLVSDRGNKIIYHGHLGPERGISVLVEAMALVRESIQDATLSLFGTFRRKRYEKKLMHQIKTLSLEKHIKWDGQLPHFEIWQHLVKNKVGVIPFKDNSLTQIGTPTKLFEFMAAGCQIVCSDLPPMTRYKSDGLIFATPGNVNNLGMQLIYALQNPNKKKIIDNYETINNQYNWEAINNRLITLYKRLL